MRKFDLLEKLEIYQIELLIYLSNVGGTATKKELLQHLDIGNYFLSKLLEELMTSAQKSNGRFSIELDKQTIIFKTKPDYSLHTLYNELIVLAPKYTILEELLLFGTIDINRLTEKIGISYSTYFRKINELNVLLNEFDLTIQNGSLIGPELQIRFFCVSLYVGVDSAYRFKISTIDPRIYETFNTIQQILDSPMSVLARKKLIIYLSLLKRRHAQKNIQDYSQQEPFFSNKSDIYSQKRFIHALKKSHLFKKINEALESFLVYYSFKMLPNETILLLLFMLGEEIIPATSHCLDELNLIEQSSDFFIRTLNKEFFDFMKTCYPNTHLSNSHKSTLRYYLSFINYRHLIFKGHIDYFGELNYTIHEKKSHSEMIRQFIAYLKGKYPVVFVDNTHDSVLITKYTHALLFYEECVKMKISVGIFIEGDLLDKKRFTDQWINYIGLTTFAQAEPLDPSQFYDLVISNIDCPYLKKRGKNFFFLTNYNEKKDYSDLDQLLNEIYSSCY
ncbi:helix-turn-helix domain-containing protein [Enterococcus sp. AZ177]|uniref:helix-turn-helix domain-containing protein n=1 Tax=unclassified Enterococcus TaxID=2608891 RepID=UPI003D30050D